jgi:hypothetical protein
VLSYRPSARHSSNNHNAHVSITNMDAPTHVDSQCGILDTLNNLLRDAPTEVPRPSLCIIISTLLARVEGFLNDKPSYGRLIPYSFSHATSGTQKRKCDPERTECEPREPKVPRHSRDLVAANDLTNSHITTDSRIVASHTAANNAASNHPAASHPAAEPSFITYVSTRPTSTNTQHANILDVKYPSALASALASAPFEEVQNILNTNENGTTFWSLPEMNMDSTVSGKPDCRHYKLLHEVVGSCILHVKYIAPH